MNRLKTEEITLIGTGKTIESAFSKAAMNMFEIVIDPKTVRNVSTKTMIFKAKTLKDALYIFIKKIYDLASNETFLLNEVKNINIDEMNNEYPETVRELRERYSFEDPVSSTLVFSHAR